MNKKYWKVLLQEWRNKGREGFTIPFIIGSQQYLVPVSSVQNIEGLLIDIVKNEDVQVYLKYCIDTEDIVLGIKDESRSKLVGFSPTFQGKEQSQLFLTSFLSDLGNDIESVIANLMNRYQSFIDAEQFSKNNRERGDYTFDEKRFIKEAFAKN